MSKSTRGTTLLQSITTSSEHECMASLVGLSGGVLGRRVEIKGCLTIGRADDCDMVLTESGVSRRHARIVMVGGAHVIFDCDSRNGLFVDGQRVQSVELRDGAQIAIGECVLKYTRMNTIERVHHDSLASMSMLDALTGLANRRQVLATLVKELRGVGRGAASVSVIALDIDHFKRINDTYGHPGGDACLREIAARMTAAIRPGDTPGRVGGEEFLIVLPQTALYDALNVAARLRTVIRSTPVRFPPDEIEVRASFGVADLSEISVSGCGRDPDGVANELVAHADRLLYRAKTEGRDRIVA